MKHWFTSRWTAPALLAAWLGIVGCAIHIDTAGQARGSSARIELTTMEGRDTWTGTWEAWNVREFLARPERTDWVQLQLVSVAGGSRSVFGFSEAGSAFQTVPGTGPSAAGGAPSHQPVELLMARPAGDLVLRGTRSGSGARGTFELKPREAFAAGLARLCGRRPDRDETVRLFFSRLSLEDLERIQAAGYRLGVEDCVRLGVSNVDADYATAMRPAFDQLSVESLVRLRQFGVPPELALAVRESGARFEADGVVRLRQFGVPPEMVRDLRRAGFDLTVDEIVRFRQFGVTAGFAAAVKNAGVDARPDQIVRMRQFGVPASYLEELSRAGGGFSVDEIVRLRQFGVPSAFIAEGRRAGYAYTAEEWVQLRNHGVSAEYLAALAIPGRKPLPAKAVIELRQRGVSPETARELRGE